MSITEPGELLSTSLSFNFLANSLNSSLLSKMAAKDPLIIFGDIGELASRRLVPKWAFRSLVSASGTLRAGTIGISFASSFASIARAVSLITAQSVQISSTVVWGEVTVNRMT